MVVTVPRRSVVAAVALATGFLGAVVPLAAAASAPAPAPSLAAGAPRPAADVGPRVGPDLVRAASRGGVDVVVRVQEGVDPVQVAPRGSARRVFRSAVNGFSARVDGPALAALQADPRVRAVEVDGTYSMTGTQTTTDLWGLDRTDQRALPLSGTFTYRGTGTGALVYVVDSGIDAGHRDFGGRVATGFSAVADGLGTGDCEGHGTHVAATATGMVLGIAKTATPVPVRVLDCEGKGKLAGVLAGLDWVVEHHEPGVPAVANLSLGGPPSPTLDAAVQRVLDDGVSVVVSAGNEGMDACDASPARLPAAVTVGATDRTDRRASWSNLGPCVDLFAPGDGILSAVPGGSASTGYRSGTSMAAPHVAGVIAVTRALDPTLSATAASARVVGAATPGVVRGAGTGSPNRLLSQSTAAPSAECPAGDDRVGAGAFLPRSGVIVPRREFSPAGYDLLAVAGSSASAITVDGLSPTTQVVSLWENRAGCSGLDASRSAWAVTPTGRVYGEASPGGPPAAHRGDASALPLNRPVVGMSPTASGNGYWLVASDGGIFSFGDARFHGSTGAMRLNRPIVGMATTPSGNGYWLVASDGGIFTFGDATFRGSTGAMRLNRPIVGMASTPTGRGYWLVASDGGIFTFGDARFAGSSAAIKPTAPTVVGMLPRASGYVLVGADGRLYSFG